MKGHNPDTRMEPWRTSIVDAGPAHIRVRGHDVLDLMKEATFTDLIFLLHHNRLPSIDERRLFDAILIGVADHGAGAPSCAAARLAASGNRQSLSAAVAAGVLTIGDEHGGAGSGCMDLIADGVGRVRRNGIPPATAAGVLVGEVSAEIYSAVTRAGVTQLAEYELSKLDVVGSTPITRSFLKPRQTSK